MKTRLFITINKTRFWLIDDENVYSVNSKFHRRNGPAYIDNYNYKYWYYNGEFAEYVDSQEEFERYIKLMVFQ